MKLRSLLKSKKAQEINITTIIVIILALVALVILVLGFTLGWGNLWAKITSWQNATGSATAYKISQCKAACASNDAVTYCSLGCADASSGTTYTCTPTAITC